MFPPFSGCAGNLCGNSDWTGSVKLLRAEAEEALLQTWVKRVILTPQQPPEKCPAHINSFELIVCYKVTKINEFPSFLFCSFLTLQSPRGRQGYPVRCHRMGHRHQEESAARNPGGRGSHAFRGPAM